MGRLNEASTDRPANVAAFQERIKAQPRATLYEVLDGFKWEYEKHELASWAPLLNHFDSCLEEYVKDTSSLSLSDVFRPEAETPEATPQRLSRRNVLALMRTTRTLLRQCASKHVYNSLERMNALLIHDDPEIAEAAMDIILEYSTKKGHAQSATLKDLKVENLLSYALLFSGRDKAKVSLHDTVVEAKEFTSAELGFASAALDFTASDAAKSSASRGSGHAVDFSPAATAACSSSSSTSADAAGSDRLAVLAVVTAPQNAEVMKELKDVGDTAAFWLRLRTRAAVRAASDMGYRRHLLRMRLKAMYALTTRERSAGNRMLMAVQNREPDLVAEIQRLIENTASVPVTVRRDALYGITALALAYRQQGERSVAMRQLVTSGPSSFFALIFKQVVEWMHSEEGQRTPPQQEGASGEASSSAAASSSCTFDLDYIEAFISMFHTVILVLSAPLFYEGGVAPATWVLPHMIRMLESRAAHHMNVQVVVLKHLDIYIEVAPTASTVFIESEGVTKMLALCHHTVMTATAALPPIEPLPANAELVIPSDKFTVPYLQRAIIKSSIQVYFLLRTPPSFAESPPTADEFKTLSQIGAAVVARATDFGPTLWSTCVRTLADMKEMDHYLLPSVFEGGLPKAFVESLQYGVFPELYSITNIPLTLEALLMHEEGRELCQEYSPMRVFVPLLTHKAYVMPEPNGSSPAIMSELCSGLDDLVRHVPPSMTATVVDSVLAAMRVLCALGGDKEALTAELGPMALYNNENVDPASSRSTSSQLSIVRSLLTSTNAYIPDVSHLAAPGQDGTQAFVDRAVDSVLGSGAARPGGEILPGVPYSRHSHASSTLQLLSALFPATEDGAAPRPEGAAQEEGGSGSAQAQDASQSETARGPGSQAPPTEAGAADAASAVEAGASASARPSNAFAQQAEEEGGIVGLLKRSMDAYLAKEDAVSLSAAERRAVEAAAASYATKAVEVYETGRDDWEIVASTAVAVMRALLTRTKVPAHAQTALIALLEAAAPQLGARTLDERVWAPTAQRGWLPGVGRGGVVTEYSLASQPNTERLEFMMNNAVSLLEVLMSATVTGAGALALDQKGAFDALLRFHRLPNFPSGLLSSKGIKASLLPPQLLRSSHLHIAQGVMQCGIETMRAALTTAIESATAPDARAAAEADAQPMLSCLARSASSVSLMGEFVRLNASILKHLVLPPESKGDDDEEAGAPLLVLVTRFELACHQLHSQLGSIADTQTSASLKALAHHLLMAEQHVRAFYSAMCKCVHHPTTRQRRTNGPNLVDATTGCVLTPEARAALAYMALSRKVSIASRSIGNLATVGDSPRDTSQALSRYTAIADDVRSLVFEMRRREFYALSLGCLNACKIVDDVVEYFSLVVDVALNALARARAEKAAKAAAESAKEAAKGDKEKAPEGATSDETAAADASAVAEPGRASTEQSAQAESHAVAPMEVEDAPGLVPMDVPPLAVAVAPPAGSSSSKGDSASAKEDGLTWDIAAASANAALSAYLTLFSLLQHVTTISSASTARLLTTPLPQPAKDDKDSKEGDSASSRNEDPAGVISALGSASLRGMLKLWAIAVDRPGALHPDTMKHLLGAMQLAYTNVKASDGSTRRRETARGKPAGAPTGPSSRGQRGGSGAGGGDASRGFRPSSETINTLVGMGFPRDQSEFVATTLRSNDVQMLVPFFVEQNVAAMMAMQRPSWGARSFYGQHRDAAAAANVAAAALAARRSTPSAGAAATGTAAPKVHTVEDVFGGLVAADKEASTALGELCKSEEEAADDEEQSPGTQLPTIAELGDGVLALCVPNPTAVFTHFWLFMQAATMDDASRTAAIDWFLSNLARMWDESGEGSSTQTAASPAQKRVFMHMLLLAAEAAKVAPQPYDPKSLLLHGAVERQLVPQLCGLVTRTVDGLERHFASASSDAEPRDVPVWLNLAFHVLNTVVRSPPLPSSVKASDEAAAAEAAAALARHRREERPQSTFFRAMGAVLARGGASEQPSNGVEPPDEPLNALDMLASVADAASPPVATGDDGQRARQGPTTRSRPAAEGERPPQRRRVAAQAEAAASPAAAADAAASPTPSPAADAAPDGTGGPAKAPNGAASSGDELDFAKLDFGRHWAPAGLLNESDQAAVLAVSTSVTRLLHAHAPHMPQPAVKDLKPEQYYTTAHPRNTLLAVLPVLARLSMRQPETSRAVLDSGVVGLLLSMPAPALCDGAAIWIGDILCAVLENSGDILLNHMVSRAESVLKGARDNTMALRSFLAHPTTKHCIVRNPYVFMRALSRACELFTRQGAPCVRLPPRPSRAADDTAQADESKAGRSGEAAAAPAQAASKHDASLKPSTLAGVLGSKLSETSKAAPAAETPASPATAKGKGKGDSEQQDKDVRAVLRLIVGSVLDAQAARARASTQQQLGADHVIARSWSLTDADLPNFKLQVGISLLTLAMARYQRPSSEASLCSLVLEEAWRTEIGDAAPMPGPGDAKMNPLLRLSLLELSQGAVKLPCKLVATLMRFVIVAACRNVAWCKALMAFMMSELTAQRNALTAASPAPTATGKSPVLLLTDGAPASGPAKALTGAAGLGSSVAGSRIAVYLGISSSLLSRAPPFGSFVLMLMRDAGADKEVPALLEVLDLTHTFAPAIAKLAFGILQHLAKPLTPLPRRTSLDMETNIKAALSQRAAAQALRPGGGAGEPIGMSNARAMPTGLWAMLGLFGDGPRGAPPQHLLPSIMDDEDAHGFADADEAAALAAHHAAPAEPSVVVDDGAVLHDDEGEPDDAGTAPAAGGRSEMDSDFEEHREYLEDALVDIEREDAAPADDVYGLRDHEHYSARSVSRSPPRPRSPEYDPVTPPVFGHPEHPVPARGDALMYEDEEEAMARGDVEDGGGDDEDDDDDGIEHMDQDGEEDGEDDDEDEGGAGGDAAHIGADPALPRSYPPDTMEEAMLAALRDSRDPGSRFSAGVEPGDREVLEEMDRMQRQYGAQVPRDMQREEDIVRIVQARFRADAGVDGGDAGGAGAGEEARAGPGSGERLSLRDLPALPELADMFEGRDQMQMLQSVPPGERGEHSTWTDLLNDALGRAQATGVVLEDPPPTLFQFDIGPATAPPPSAFGGPSSRLHPLNQGDPTLRMFSGSAGRPLQAGEAYGADMGAPDFDHFMTQRGAEFEIGADDPDEAHYGRAYRALMSLGPLAGHDPDDLGVGGSGLRAVSRRVMPIRTIRAGAGASGWGGMHWNVDSLDAPSDFDNITAQFDMLLDEEAAGAPPHAHHHHHHHHHGGPSGVTDMLLLADGAGMPAGMVPLFSSSGPSSALRRLPTALLSTFGRPLNGGEELDLVLPITGMDEESDVRGAPGNAVRDPSALAAIAGDTLADLMPPSLRPALHMWGGAPGAPPRGGIGGRIGSDIMNQLLSVFRAQTGAPRGAGGGSGVGPLLRQSASPGAASDARRPWSDITAGAAEVGRHETEVVPLRSMPAELIVPSDANFRVEDSVNPTTRRLFAAERLLSAFSPMVIAPPTREPHTIDPSSWPRGSSPFGVGATEPGLDSAALFLRTMSPPTSSSSSSSSLTHSDVLTQQLLAAALSSSGRARAASGFFDIMAHPTSHAARRQQRHRAMENSMSVGIGGSGTRVLYGQAPDDASQPTLLENSYGRPGVFESAVMTLLPQNDQQGAGGPAGHPSAGDRGRAVHGRGDGLRVMGTRMPQTARRTVPFPATEASDRPIRAVLGGVEAALVSAQRLLNAVSVEARARPRAASTEELLTSTRRLMAELSSAASQVRDQLDQVATSGAASVTVAHIRSLETLSTAATSVLRRVHDSLRAGRASAAQNEAAQADQGQPAAAPESGAAAADPAADATATTEASASEPAQASEAQANEQSAGREGDAAAAPAAANAGANSAAADVAGRVLELARSIDQQTASVAEMLQSSPDAAAASAGAETSTAAGAEPAQQVAPPSGPEAPAAAQDDAPQQQQPASAQADAAQAADGSGDAAEKPNEPEASAAAAAPAAAEPEAAPAAADAAAVPAAAPADATVAEGDAANANAEREWPALLTERVRERATAAGLDLDTLASLPAELLRDALVGYGIDPNESAAPPAPPMSDVDPALWNMLPPELVQEGMRAEMARLQQTSGAPRSGTRPPQTARRSQPPAAAPAATAAAGADAAAPAAVGADAPAAGSGLPSHVQDFVQIIRSFPADVREDALLGAEASLIEQLPEAMREEARALRAQRGDGHGRATAHRGAPGRFTARRRAAFDRAADARAAALSDPLTTFIQQGVPRLRASTFCSRPSWPGDPLYTASPSMPLPPAAITSILKFVCVAPQHQMTMPLIDVHRLAAGVFAKLPTSSSGLFAITRQLVDLLSELALGPVPRDAPEQSGSASEQLPGSLLNVDLTHASLCKTKKSALFACNSVVELLSALAGVSTFCEPLVISPVAAGDARGKSAMRDAYTSAFQQLLHVLGSDLLKDVVGLRVSLANLLSLLVTRSAGTLIHKLHTWLSYQLRSLKAADERAAASGLQLLQAKDKDGKKASDSTTAAAADAPGDKATASAEPSAGPTAAAAPAAPEVESAQPATPSTFGRGTKRARDAEPRSGGSEATPTRMTRRRAQAASAAAAAAEASPASATLTSTSTRHPRRVASPAAGSSSRAAASTAAPASAAGASRAAGSSVAAQPSARGSKSSQTAPTLPTRETTARLIRFVEVRLPVSVEVLRELPREAITPLIELHKPGPAGVAHLSRAKRKDLCTTLPTVCQLAPGLIAPTFAALRDAFVANAEALQPIWGEIEIVAAAGLPPASDAASPPGINAPASACLELGATLARLLQITRIFEAHDALVEASKGWDAVLAKGETPKLPPGVGYLANVEVTASSFNTDVAHGGLARIYGEAHNRLLDHAKKLGIAVPPRPSSSPFDPLRASRAPDVATSTSDRVTGSGNPAPPASGAAAPAGDAAPSTSNRAQSSTSQPASASHASFGYVLPLALAGTPEASRPDANDLLQRLRDLLTTCPLWHSLSTCVKASEEKLLKQETPPGSQGPADPPHRRRSGSSARLPEATRRLQPLVECYLLLGLACGELPGSNSEGPNMAAAAIEAAERAGTVSGELPHAPSLASRELLPEDVDDLTAMTPANFMRRHRVLLNAYVAASPTSLEGPFACMLATPRLLDFHNKSAYFREKMRTLTRGGPAMGELRLSVSRSTVFEDSFVKLKSRSVEEWRQQLKVEFRGEEGLDMGGVTREWFEVMGKEIFNPNLALFVSVPPEGNTYQPSPSAQIQSERGMDVKEYFRFVGRFVGKALADGQLLNAYFTRAFYKHMLGQTLKLKDLSGTDPDLHKQLENLIKYPRVQEVLPDQAFITEVNFFGRSDTVELKPGGSSILVTDENKEEYVNLLARHYMTGAISSSIQAFQRGLWEVVPLDILSIFSHAELELMISGLPDIDVEDLRRNATYGGGLSANDQVVRWFWEVTAEMEKEHVAELLQFVTGSSKVPLGGFAHLRGYHGPQKFAIHRAGTATDHLPTAHTCFNQLDLPAYESKEQLRARLMLAIREGATGFAFA